MNSAIYVIRKTRIKLLELIKDLNPEQLNEIPAGFNNNIIWNIGHMISAQQGLCYIRAGVPSAVDEPFRLAYQPGSKPEQMISAQEIAGIKHLLLSTLDQLEDDMQNNLFINYIPWTNRFDIELTNINDVLYYLPYHEGLHADRIKILLKQLDL